MKPLYHRKAGNDGDFIVVTFRQCARGLQLEQLSCNYGSRLRRYAAANPLLRKCLLGGRRWRHQGTMCIFKLNCPIAIRKMAVAPANGWLQPKANLGGLDRSESVQGFDLHKTRVFEASSFFPIPTLWRSAPLVRFVYHFVFIHCDGEYYTSMRRQTHNSA